MLRRKMAKLPNVCLSVPDHHNPVMNDHVMHSPWRQQCLSWQHVPPSTHSYLRRRLQGCSQLLKPETACQDSLQTLPEPKKASICQTAGTLCSWHSERVHCRNSSPEGLLHDFRAAQEQKKRKRLSKELEKSYRRRKRRFQGDVDVSQELPAIQFVLNAASGFAPDSEEFHSILPGHLRV